MIGTNLFSPQGASVQIALANEQGHAMFVKCATGDIPSGVAGYGVGCLLTDTTTGNLFINTGTASSCTFTDVTADTPANVALADTHIMVGNGAGVGADVAMSGDATIANTGAVTIANDAITTAKILNANVTLAKLASGITPSHVVKYAGKITWSGSGASKATTVSGVLSTDIVVATIQTAPTQSAYIVSVAPTTDTVTVTLSAANTSNDAVIAYTVLRAAA